MMPRQYLSVSVKSYYKFTYSGVSCVVRWGQVYVGAWKQAPGPPLNPSLQSSPKVYNYSSSCS